MSSKSTTVKTQAIRIDHALLKHKVTLMRTATSTSKFRRLMREITIILGVEATRDFPTVVSDKDGVDGILLYGRKAVIIAILRSGMGMTEGLVELMPSARIGHIGIHHDRSKKVKGKPDETVTYMLTLPDLTGRTCVIVDPIIGTGIIACGAIDILMSLGVPESSIRFLSIVASAQGLSKITAEYPNVRIFYAEDADGLTEDGWVTPEWGDAADRLFGVKENTTEIGE